MIGVKEAAGLNIFLALTDLATQALLVIIGLFAVFSPAVLRDNVHLGVTPSWTHFIIAIPVAMVAYTGIETVSNMAEEAIDPPRHVPRAIMYVVVAVFAIYAFLPSVALSAMPVQPATAAMATATHDPKYGCASQGVARGNRPRAWPASTPTTRLRAWSTTSACRARSRRARLLRRRSWLRRSW